ncbi:MAG: hypothetical protein IH984_00225 [Planctomycetes bacterium]|nr:hypothetical protein [Planctomycetota bacterium]
MSINPLPVFEADADPRHRSAMTDEEIYAKLEPPKTVVVRFGMMKMVGEYPTDGTIKPGCGTKLVVRTHRGIELAEMLTTTCENSGCSKSVTRQEMLDYIENSGGSDYPFFTDGKILRIATIEDLNKHSAALSNTSDAVKQCKALVEELDLSMKLVEAEPILGGEQITFYFMSESRVDFRELVRKLASEHKTRIEMRQVGARDEARLVADYERCGQHCCCKSFLKVLKPVSMRSAKLQNVPLDPLKISGRCGRLMCCLRYEDATYQELKKNLPPRNSRVGTYRGPGIVVNTKLLVQLALVKLDQSDEEIAVPIEELVDPENCPQPGTKEWDKAQLADQAQPSIEEDPLRGLPPIEVAERTDDKKRTKRRRDRGRRKKSQQQDSYREKSIQAEDSQQTQADATDSSEKPKRKRKRRRRKRKPGGSGAGGNSGDSSGNTSGGTSGG